MSGPDLSDRVRDPNLKLAILNALALLGRVDLGSDAPEDEFEPDARIRERFLAMPISQEDADAITTLTWAGGHPIQHAIWSQWDGEDEYFDIRDLTGLSLLRNLVSLDCVACLYAEDLSAIAALPKLEKLLLGRAPASIDFLLDLPALTHLTLWGVTESPVLDTLRTRGVTIVLH